MLDAFVHLNGTHLRAATAATWTALRYLHGGLAPSAKEQCLEAARLVTPTPLTAGLDTLVTERLYARLRPMAETLRAQVEPPSSGPVAATHTAFGPRSC